MNVPLHEMNLISRRESLRRVALLLGVAALPSWLRLEAQSASGTATVTLTDAQLNLATAAADLIIPRTDTPGAADVGIREFITEIYHRYMDAKERDRFDHGIKRIQALSAEMSGKDFISLNSSQRKDVLSSLAGGDQADIQSFAALRELTLIGYFTSEEVCKNVLRYDPIPGRYEEIPVSSTGNVSFSS